jgi:hypothetical protein
MTTSSNEQECPQCLGKGTVYGQVQWSDGLGGVTCQCSLCDGKGVLDVLAELRKYKKQALESRDALDQMQRQVLCYLDTSDPKRGGNVRGMPGAAPYATTWLPYLQRTADATAARLTTEVRLVERQDHEKGHHTKPVPAWACALTNARAYCPLCHP